MSNFLAIAFALVFFATPTMAQKDEVDARFARSNSVLPQDAGEVKISWAFEWEAEDRIDSYSTPFTIEYGFSERLEIFAEIPYRFDRGSEIDVDEYVLVRHSGIPSLEFGLGYLLYLNEEAGFAFSSEFKLGVPAQSGSRDFGDSAISFSPSLSVFKSFGTIELDLGWTTSFEEAREAGERDEISHSIDLEALYANEPISPFIGLSYAFTGDERETQISTGLFWEPEFLEDFEVQASAFANIESGGSDFGAAITFSMDFKLTSEEADPSEE